MGTDSGNPSARRTGMSRARTCRGGRERISSAGAALSPRPRGWGYTSPASAIKHPRRADSPSEGYHSIRGCRSASSARATGTSPQSYRLEPGLRRPLYQPVTVRALLSERCREHGLQPVPRAGPGLWRHGVLPMPPAEPVLLIHRRVCEVCPGLPRAPRRVRRAASRLAGAWGSPGPSG